MIVHTESGPRIGYEKINVLCPYLHLHYEIIY